MKKTIKFIGTFAVGFVSLAILASCASETQNESAVLSETEVSQKTGLSKEDQQNSEEISIDNSNVSSIDMSNSGFDPNRPRETAEFIKSYFYVDDSITSNTDRPDGREQLHIGNDYSVLLDQDGRIYAVFLSNLYKNEVENIFEEFNISDLSPYSEPLETDITNFEENHFHHVHIEKWDDVAIGVRLNTKFDVDEHGRDKPYAMVIAYDNEYINIIMDQGIF